MSHTDPPTLQHRVRAWPRLGLIGVVRAYSYNKILIATRDSTDDDGYYYRFVWGREPVMVDREGGGQMRRTEGGAAMSYRSGAADSGRYARGGTRYSRMAVAGTTPPSSSTAEDGEYDPAAACGMHTSICVTRCCRNHPNGVGCTADCRGGEDAGGGGGKGNFKLRIPYTLDHPK